MSANHTQQQPFRSDAATQNGPSSQNRPADSDAAQRWQEPLEQAGIDPDAIMNTASECMEKTAEIIRKRPLESVGFAVGLGLLAGIVVKQAFNRPG